MVVYIETATRRVCSRLDEDQRVQSWNGDWSVTIAGDASHKRRREREREKKYCFVMGCLR